MKLGRSTCVLVWVDCVPIYSTARGNCSIYNARHSRSRAGNFNKLVIIYIIKYYMLFYFAKYVIASFHLSPDIVDSLNFVPGRRKCFSAAAIRTAFEADYRQAAGNLVVMQKGLQSFEVQSNRKRKIYWVGSIGPRSIEGPPWERSFRIIRKAPCSILSTASDPHVLHRPWISKSICDTQLTQNHRFSIGSPVCHWH